MPHSFILSLGSNTEEASRSVTEALSWICDHFNGAIHSECYATAPAGSKGGDRQYVNAVAAISAEMDKDSLDLLLKAYELSHGRDEKSRQEGIVPIDIDIVVSDGDIIRQWEYGQSFFQTGFCQIEEATSQDKQ